MKIYHGSHYIIKNPAFDKGKTNNDYGKGFYCTEDIELAREWSVSHNIDGYANEYELDINDLKVLKLNSENYCILHWLTLLLKNRNFDGNNEMINLAKDYLFTNFNIDISSYDIVIGQRADDSYYRFVQEFLNNSASINKLNYGMHVGDLKEQIVLVSKKAFKNIKFINAHKVSKKDYYKKRQERDKKALKNYLNYNDDFNNLFIVDIVRGKLNEKSKELYL